MFRGQPSPGKTEKADHFKATNCWLPKFGKDHRPPENVSDLRPFDGERVYPIPWDWFIPGDFHHQGGCSNKKSYELKPTEDLFHFPQKKGPQKTQKKTCRENREQPWPIKKPSLQGLVFFRATVFPRWKWPHRAGSSLPGHIQQWTEGCPSSTWICRSIGGSDAGTPREKWRVVFRRSWDPNGLLMLVFLEGRAYFQGGVFFGRVW